MSEYRCEYCDTVLLPGMQLCPGCGAPNPRFDPAAAATAQAVPPVSGKPKTIGELRAFCTGKGMPLDKMRFFIGVDERSPRAFGIYREGSDFIVYKNKSDGTRAIRYRGPDEAFAVNEIYQKLLEEHRQRTGGSHQNPPPGSAQHNTRNRKQSRTSLLPIILILLGYLVFSAVPKLTGHRSDGYYRVGEDLFYRYGTAWFMDAGGGYSDGWTEIDDFPYENANTYYQGNSYDDTWGASDFKDSWAWDEYQDSSDYDSDDSDWDSDWDDYDYDDWDSGDTDWDSDW